MPKNYTQVDFTGQKGINLAPGVNPTDAVNVSQLTVGSVTRRFKQTNINGKVVGNTTVFTTAAGLGRFFVTSFNIKLVSTTGSPGTPPEYNLGFTASAYGDIYLNRIGVLLIVNNYVDMPVSVQQITGATLNNVPSVPPSTAVVVRVATAATIFTTYVADVYVEGYYESDAI